MALEINDSLIELQMRLAFQEESILQLSDQMARQAEDLRIAQRQIVALNQKLNDVLQGSDGHGQKTDERPPHY